LKTDGKGFVQMNNKKFNPIGIILSEIVGYDIKKLKAVVDQCPWHSVSDEQLHKMLHDEIAMPWRLQANLCEYALKKIEGWEDLNCEEFETYARLIVHLEWFLNNKKMHIQWQKRLQALVDEYIDILSVE
jgi:hypothetical protein